jgi:hypothetical protein
MIPINLFVHFLEIQASSLEERLTTAAAPERRQEEVKE